jgi:FkbM family methyltransferase
MAHAASLGIRTTFHQAALRSLVARTRPPLRRVGGAEHGWTIPEPDPSWVCYTVGVGEDTSFDEALLELGCEVVAVDPTPRAVEHIAPLLRSWPRLRFAPYALWMEDTEVDFFAPSNPADVSFSITNRQSTADKITVPARTLDAIRAEMGHGTVDLLKVDIEGAEYDVMPALDLQALGVRVLCVEYHPDHGVPTMIRAVRSMRARGYVPVNVTRTDVTFVRA